MRRVHIAKPKPLGLELVMERETVGRSGVPVCAGYESVERVRRRVVGHC